MIGAIVAVEEGVWRRLRGGTCDNAKRPKFFDQFDGACPDLVSTKRLRLRGHWSILVEGLDSDGDDEVRTEVCATLSVGVLTVESLAHFPRVSDRQASNESRTAA